MNCRTWSPFYEKNIDGKCVKVPPAVAKDSPLDLLILGALIGGLGLIVYKVISKV